MINANILHELASSQFFVCSYAVYFIANYFIYYDIGRYMYFSILRSMSLILFFLYQLDTNYVNILFHQCHLCGLVELLYKHMFRLTCTSVNINKLCGLVKCMFYMTFVIFPCGNYNSKLLLATLCNTIC